MRNAFPIRVLSVDRFGRDELLESLRETRLRGFGGARPYTTATLRLTQAADPDELTPAQRYVLTPGLRRALALREALLPHGVDTLALDGGAWVRAEGSRDLLPVIPPIVEEAREPGGATTMLIADGIHRVFLARQLGLYVNTVTIADIPARFPYYSLAEPAGWSAVREFEELPEGFQKKDYRDPTNYEALYRDFDGVFPGLQEERTNSNPAYLQP